MFFFFVGGWGVVDFCSISKYLKVNSHKMFLEFIVFIVITTVHNDNDASI